MRRRGACRAPGASGAAGSPAGTGRVIRSTAVLTGLAAVSGLLGFGRDVVIAAVFGVDSAVDAYLVAQGLMNLVLALVAGAIAKALVPTVSRSVAEGQQKRTSAVVSTVLTATAAILLPAAALMAVSAEAVIAVIAPGFPSETAQEAARLTRIVLLATVLVAGTDILAAASQAHGRFVFSGLQGIPFNLAMIAFTVLLGARWGGSALAVGFVVGSGLRLATQLPAVRALRLRLRPALRLRDRDVAEVLRLVPALLVGTALVNINTLVDRAVGSGAAEGTIAALSFGWRLVTLPYTLFVISFVAALYPTLSALAGLERREELRRVTGRSVAGVLVLLAPVAGVLLGVAEPLVRLVLGRGQFGADAVGMTSTAVSWFALALIGVAVAEVCSRAFYALGDSRTPVALAVVGMLVNVVGDLLLGPRFGVAGIAAATTASFLLVATGQVVALHARHRALDLRPLSGTLTRCTIAAVSAGATAWFLVQAGAAGAGRQRADLLPVTIAGAASVAVYLGVLVLLRGPELGEVRAMAVRVWRRAAPAVSTER